ncbi:MAG: class I SAM-dependent methyltransferase [Acidobacteriota bacterium]
MDTADMVNFFRVVAPYYDADYAAINYTADIGFYVDLARQCGGPVLEMGCGTGRVLLATARAGVRIHGLEISPDMLAVLRDKLCEETPEVRERVALTEGDICSVDLGARFPLVTAPFRVLQALAERADQRAWLRNVRRHLAPGGALSFDVFQPNYSFLSETRGPSVDMDRPDPATGGRIRRFSRTIPHNEHQKLEVHLQWAHEDAAGNRMSESSARVVLRWFTRAELESLLELEGFRITDYWGSFAREPFGPGSGDQVIRAVAGV